MEKGLIFSRLVDNYFIHFSGYDKYTSCYISAMHKLLLELLHILNISPTTPTMQFTEDVSFGEKKGFP